MHDYWYDLHEVPRCIWGWHQRIVFFKSASNLLIWGYFTMLCLVIITPFGQGLAAAVELTTTSTTGNIAQILKKMTATHHHHHLHRQYCTNIEEDGCTLHKTIASAALLTSCPGNDLKWQIAFNSLENAAQNWWTEKFARWKHIVFRNKDIVQNVSCDER